MGTNTGNTGNTGNQDSSKDKTDGHTSGTTGTEKSAGTTGHSPEFGKVSGSAGAGGSQSSTSKDDPMKASDFHGKPRQGLRDDGSIEGGEGDADGTDASGSRRNDSISGMIDSGNKSPARGNSSSTDPSAGTPESPGSSR